MWGGRPRPPTLFADVLTTRDPTLVKRHDECSTSICHPESAPVHLVIPNPLQRCQYTRPCTLSFRIRFSGEESAFPASRFQETRRAPCLATLSTWDSRSEEHTSELQSHSDLVCRLLLEKKKDFGLRI